MGGTAKWRFEKRILCFIPGWSSCCFAPLFFGEHGIFHAFPALGLLCSRAARQLMGMDIEHAIPWNVMPNHQMTILFGDEGDGHHDITEEYVSGTLYYKDKYIYILSADPLPRGSAPRSFELWAAVRLLFDGFASVSPKATFVSTIDLT